MGNLKKLVLSFGLILSTAANAQYAYLNDANQQGDRPNVPGNFPKIMATETQSDGGTNEQWSKYDLIGAKAGMMYRIAAAQKINPAVQFHYSFHPRSYLGYIGQPCEISFGIPFGGTGSKTEGCNVYAGHWLYRAGTRLTAGLNNTATTVRVQDAGRFQAGKYAVIYSGGPGAFNNAEHVRISSVNKSNNTLVLSKRGFKSTPRSHGTGAIIAQHEQGRSGAAENWAWNITTAGPRDASGRTIAQVFVNWIPANWTKNSKGQAQNVRVDGVYFDEDEYILNGQNVDANNDLVVDNGWSGSRNIWGEGLDSFYSQLRNRIGSKRIVAGWRLSRGYENLNGIQMENWLTVGNEFTTNYKYTGRGDAYSQLHNYTIATNYYRKSTGYSETLSKAPTRLYPGTVKTGCNPTRPANNSNFRLGFGASLLNDGYYGRQNSKCHPDPWYDEYAVDVRKGSSTYGHAIKSNPNNEYQIRQHKGWLGRPLGPRTRIYNSDQFKASRSLISNGGFEGGKTGWKFQNIGSQIDTSTKVAGNNSLKTTGMLSYNRGIGGASLRGPGVKMVQGRRYTFVFAAKSSKMREIQIRMDWSDQIGVYMVPQRWTRFVYTITAKQSGTFNPNIDLGREDTTVWFDEAYVFEGDPNVFRRDYQNGIVVVNLTPNGKTVNLGGSFKRIKGTGQDSINNGATINSVTIPRYDAAILVRPNGGSVTLPPADGGDTGGDTGGGTDGGGGGTGSAALGGEAWRDSNADGIQGGSESGWGGVTMRLLTCGGSEIRRKTTASNGSYAFNNLAAGSYRIGVIKPTGASLSPAFRGSDGGKDSNIQPDNMTACMTLGGGQKKLAVDAGLIPSGSSSGGGTDGGTGGSTGSAQIGDFVWADWNANGIQNSNEGGRPNVRVRLETCTGTVLQALTTDKSGAYKFSVAPGSYRLKFIPPAGERLSPSFSGTNGALDSNANPSNGLTGCMVLNKGDVKGWVDAGVIP